MDWKLCFTTFATIFIAELGDKTQFAAVLVSSQSKTIIEVLCGVVLALACAGCIGVFAGKVLSTFINPHILKYLSGTLFILMGAWIITR